MYQCNLRGLLLLIPHVCVFGADGAGRHCGIWSEFWGIFWDSFFGGRGISGVTSAANGQQTFCSSPHKNMGNPKKKLSPPKISLRSFSPPSFLCAGDMPFHFHPSPSKEREGETESVNPPSSRLGCQCYMMSLLPPLPLGGI